MDEMLRNWKVSKNELTAQGVEVLTLPFDVRNRQAMTEAIHSTERQMAKH